MSQSIQLHQLENPNSYRVLLYFQNEPIYDEYRRDGQIAKKYRHNFES